MLTSYIKRGLVIMTIALALGFFLANRLTSRTHAQAPQGGNQANTPAANPDDPPAEQVFKNIQVLKGVPKSQIDPIMDLISASVGMKCDQCHVGEAYEKDDKRNKQTARNMIKMTLDINKNSFNGRTQVTCYSCHRGQERPVNLPSLELAPSAASEPRPAPVQPGQGPTFDQLVEKYVQAVGGSEAFGKLKSRMIKGSFVTSDGKSLPVEIYQAAPNKMVMTTTLPNGVALRGFNGTTGWIQGPDGQHEVKGAELAQLKRSADLARSIKAKEEYLNPRMAGKTKIGNREAYRVLAQADGQRVQLFFDAETGLLLRRVTTTNTVIGALPMQVDFEDYRIVDGVKIPFITRQSTAHPGAASVSTLKFTEIKHNVPVDDAKFNPPAQK